MSDIFKRKIENFKALNEKLKNEINNLKTVDGEEAKRLIDIQEDISKLVEDISQTQFASSFGKISDDRLQYEQRKVDSGAFGDVLITKDKQLALKIIQDKNSQDDKEAIKREIDTLR